MIQEVKLNIFQEETKSHGAYTVLHEGTEYSRVKHLLPLNPPRWQQGISTMSHSRILLT